MQGWGGWSVSLDQKRLQGMVVHPMPLSTPSCHCPTGSHDSLCLPSSVEFPAGGTGGGDLSRPLGL